MYKNIELKCFSKGKLVLTPNLKQPFEIKASQVLLLGDSPTNYPIQPKRHTREFLREVAHLRPRTNLFQAVFRLRSVAAMAVHEFFQNQGFVYTHTPIITGNDGEGAGQMFNVTTMPLNNVPKDKEGNVDFKKDFGKQAYLTVTGQLHGEAYAMTFSTYTHLDHLSRKSLQSMLVVWMIEPEMAFADLKDNMDITEAIVKYIIKYVYDKLQKKWNSSTSLL